MKRDTTIRIFSLLIALFLVVPAVQAALTVDAGDDRIALAGEPITILATYNDTDVFDALNMSASVNWSTATTAPEIVPDDDYNGTIQDVYTYSAAGTYVVTVKVANNATGAVACDTLNVTVSPQSAEVKVVPKTLNQKSNGLMTIFVDLAEWLGFGDSSSANVTVPDPSEFRIGNATPERVNFCMKDGGTLILKYRRADLDLNAGDGNLTVTGNVTTEEGNIPVLGSGAVSVINPGNKKMEKDNGHAGNGKEKMKNQNAFGDEHPRFNGNAKGQAP
ncbi:MULTISPECIES: hypothetical protein [unclassified Methanoculleus]|jgi:hypothetical protein|uniref:hypothetical protein n=1 Tax=unclassified Methanoculleus TaxID=2619537 RepID=UPI0025E9448F|nr:MULTISPECIES: hypothetical protein [unclassified Methanoculleus]MCK9316886.1 hypothetical protein [Methanoculleus sp.]MDD2253331.1 hypothetical protein [Methanoculleus sp.]MDD2787518.1 hypothetical protein [Methanoculleus sp.]MDD3215091.1 hypothetical protein [Methanoculleus sp.]MDD4313105.1 hypothetical protein [Methanoculleus sp.]